MNTPIEYLPPVRIEGHQSSGAGGPDHPMRIATRRAAGLDAGGWTSQLRKEVAEFFDTLSGEWHTRTSPQRTAVVSDALERGLGPLNRRPGIAVEVGSGIGTYSGLIAQRFTRVVAIDLSLAMLDQAPVAVAQRIQADGAMLPLRDGRSGPDQRLLVSG
jgi:SAM-dependent methyltransferase